MQEGDHPDVGALWDLVNGAETAEDVLRAAEKLVRVKSERQEFNNAAECVIVAVDRAEAMDAIGLADEWLAGLQRHYFWKGLMGESYFRKWLADRQNREHDRLQDELQGREDERDACVVALSYRESEPRSVPCQCESDDALIAKCEDVFSDLRDWLAEHEGWSLGGRSVLVAINRSRRRNGDQQLWNPAAFGLRFVDPAIAAESERSSLLSGVAQGQLRIIDVKLGVAGPGEGGRNVLD